MRNRKNIYTRKNYLFKIALILTIIALVTILIEVTKESSPEVSKISREIALDHAKIER